MKLYLDNCCFNRPYDSQTTNKILIETRAKLLVQDEIRAGKHELVGSYMLEYENEQNPFEMKKQTIRTFQKQYSTQYVSFELRESLVAKINEITRYNIHYKDATHVACAIYAKCDYLLTTDARLQQRYRGDEIRIVNPVEFVRLESEKEETEELCPRK